jgi:hypothetical protein
MRWHVKANQVEIGKSLGRYNHHVQSITYIHDRAYEHDILRRSYQTRCNLEAGKLRA